MVRRPVQGPWVNHVIDAWKIAEVEHKTGLS